MEQALRSAAVVVGLVCAAPGALGTPPPCASEVELAPVPGEPLAQFGFDVATDGRTVVVGAVRRDGAFSDQGAAYVFEVRPDGLEPVAVLRAADGEPDGQFGCAVAVQADRVVVGARRVFGTANLSGAVYVFERTGNAWRQTAKLVVPGGLPGDEVGHAVALDGDRVAAGAPGVAADAGAAYLFRHHAGAWLFETALPPSDPGEGRLYGNAVAIDGETVAVGSRRASGAVGAAGEVYVFRWIDKDWTEEARLFPDDVQIFGSFGESVSLAGARLVVGAPGGPFAGAVHVYELADGRWSRAARLVPTDGFATDDFGYRVEHEGDTILVGARHDDDLGPSSGSAYVFERAPRTGAWFQRRKLHDPGGAAGDEYGNAVALAGELVVVGAHFDDPAGFHSGSARVHARPAPEPGVPTCPGDGSGAACPCGNVGGAGEGCAHSGGRGIALRGAGSESVAADDLVLVAEGCPPLNAGRFFAGTTELAGAPLFDGLVCAGGEVRRFRGLFQADGAVSDTGFGAQDPSGAFLVPGVAVVFQYWTRDVSAGPSPCGSGAALSAGYRVLPAP